MRSTNKEVLPEKWKSRSATLLKVGTALGGDARECKLRLAIHTGHCNPMEPRENR